MSVTMNASARGREEEGDAPSHISTLLVGGSDEDSAGIAGVAPRLFRSSWLSNSTRGIKAGTLTQLHPLSARVS